MSETRTIPLTKGKFTIVDAEDYEMLTQWEWHTLQCRPNNIYAIRTARDANGKYQLVKMHRVLTNPPANMEVDHIDGNGLNNTKANLRVCTHQQNTQNRRKPSDNTTGYKGVYISKRNKIHPYQAYVCINNKQKWLGYFSTAIEAAKVYNEAATKYYGRFARLNESLIQEDV